jgi:hypothetical protein
MLMHFVLVIAGKARAGVQNQSSITLFSEVMIILLAQVRFRIDSGGAQPEEGCHGCGRHWDSVRRMVIFMGRTTPVRPRKNMVVEKIPQRGGFECEQPQLDTP